MPGCIEPGPSDREFTHTFVLFYFFCAKRESFKLESVASSSSFSRCCCCRDRERGLPKREERKDVVLRPHTQCPFGRAAGGYDEDTLAAGHTGSCECVGLCCRSFVEVLPQKKDSLVRSPLGEVSEHRTVACLFLLFLDLLGLGIGVLER